MPHGIHKRPRNGQTFFLPRPPIRPARRFPQGTRLSSQKARARHHGPHGLVGNGSKAQLPYIVLVWSTIGLCDCRLGIRERTGHAQNHRWLYTFSFEASARQIRLTEGKNRENKHQKRGSYQPVVSSVWYGIVPWILGMAVGRHVPSYRGIPSQNQAQYGRQWLSANQNSLAQKQSQMPSAVLAQFG